MRPRPKEETARSGSARTTLLVGSGKLGGRLGDLITAEGGEVLALRRRTGDLPAHIKGISADLREPLAEPLPSVDALVITLPPSVDPAGYVPVLQRLNRALSATPARTIFVSSTGVFEGWDGPQPITERDVPRPATARAQTLRDGESAAIELFGAIIVRPAGIYGPGRDFLLRAVRERRPVASATRTNRIHETDLVRTLHGLLVHEDPPRILHAVDESPAPLGDVTDYISRLLGVEPPPESDAPGRAGNVLDGTQLVRFLGVLRYPTFRDGYREMIAGPLAGSPDNAST